MTAFLSILRGVLLLSQTCRPVKSRRAHRVFRNLLESIKENRQSAERMRTVGGV